MTVSFSVMLIVIFTSCQYRYLPLYFIEKGNQKITEVVKTYVEQSDQRKYFI